MLIRPLSSCNTTMSTLSPLYRVPFIAIAVVLHHHTINPRTSAGLDRKKDSMSEKTVLSNVRIATGLVQVVVGSLGIIEIVTIIQEGQYSPNTYFFIGTSLVIVGALVREWCFHILGSMFTFEIGIVQDKHHLVDTGPYAVVRHPSYSGLFLEFIGLWMWQSAQGSWIRESGVLESWAGKGFAIFWAVFTAVTVASFLGRTKAEDRMLERHFGNEWKTWATRVPYLLVPYVY